MKTPAFKIFLKTLIVVILLSFYGFLLAKKIDLTTADLGRHLKNGELVLSSGFNSFRGNSILNTNFYSYTQPNYPFINHHWLSGVIFFVVQKIAGFAGLSLFYIFLSLLTFLLFFLLASRPAGFKIAVLASLLLIPLIAERGEIRPEVFGYLFGALFLCLLTSCQKSKRAKFWLLILPGITLLWVNLHISFFIGLFLISIFWLENLIKIFPSFQRRGSQGMVGRDNKAQGLNRFGWLTLVLGTSILIAFLNPNTWRGVIYPINIFRNYGYRIVENQSIIFLEKWGFEAPNLLHFEVAFAILSLSFIFAFIKKYTRWTDRAISPPSGPDLVSHLFKKIRLTNVLPAIVFSLMAWFGLRNLTLFGFFMLPVLATNIKLALPQKLTTSAFKSNFFFVVFGLVIITFIGLNSHEQIALRWETFGIGLAPHNNLTVNFFQKQNIQGPIFNNYDIGSFLIYYLYPEEKVFVDNRPETYPVSFFEEVYIPMQEDGGIWQQQSAKYNFNVIYFQYHDLTPWAQEFLIARVNDSAWAPVFADAYAIIFLKRNGANEPVIKKYEIPKENFRVSEAK